MADKLKDLYQDLLDKQNTEETKLPPVAHWDPPLSGDIDIRIAADGAWYHEGSIISRAPLVKVFSGILKREQDDYFLVTPVEKWRIQVEDAPFYVVDMEVTHWEGQQALFFTTLTGDRVLADGNHPIRVQQDSRTGEPRPYVLIRDTMEGLINRAVYYRLAELVEEKQINGKTLIGVSSMSSFFPVM